MQIFRLKPEQQSELGLVCDWDLLKRAIFIGYGPCGLAALTHGHDMDEDLLLGLSDDMGYQPTSVLIEVLDECGVTVDRR